MWRYATNGALTAANTHPFLQDGRLFAHNGVVEGVEHLDTRLRELGASELVGGQTDSERVFALITAHTRRRGGDVGAGIRDAVGWIADNLPVYALNILLSGDRLLGVALPRLPRTLCARPPRVRVCRQPVSTCVLIGSAPGPKVLLRCRRWFSPASR